MRHFDYLEPETVEKASAWLRQRGEKAALLAGGTDLLVKIQEDKCQAEVLISLAGIPGLNDITFNLGEGLSLGAMVTLARAASHRDIQEYFPLLADACLKVGSQQIRNMGTVGGNLCNASPAADLAPTLLVLGAQAQVIGTGGRRLIPLDHFFLGPGKTALIDGEILERLLIPIGPPSGIYLKHTIRKAMDLPIVGIAVLLKMEDSVCREARVALGAVAPTPLRAPSVERFLKGQRLTHELLEQAGHLALQAISPISDIRASAEYRREMVRVLTKRAIRQAEQVTYAPRRER